MSLPRNPLNFVTGETLTPTKLNVGFERMALDLINQTNRRYCHSSFELDWSGVASTGSAEEFIFRLKPPWAWEVESVEIVLYEPTGTVTNVALDSSMTGWETVNVEPLGATTRAKTDMNFKARGAANTEVTFTLTVTAGGAYTLDRCYAIFHIRADRNNSGITASNHVLSSAPRFATGDSVAAAKVNGGFTDYQTAVTANTNCNRQMRIQVFSLRQIAVALATSDRDLRIPSSLRRFHSYDVVNLGAVGDNLTFTILDEGAATVSTTTVNGSGTPPAKTQGTTVSDTQTLDQMTTPSSDYKFRFTRAGAAIIPLGYAVVYTS